MRHLASLSPLDRPFVARRIMNRLTLFGGAVLNTPRGAIAGRAAQRHRLALMALLSTTRRHQRSRDQLVTLLWPDANAEHGRKLLSDSIYRINQALGVDTIVGTGEEVHLNRSLIGSDVADFEAAIASHEWRRAVELYAGPFLDGFYLPRAPECDQWMESERAQYARSVAKAMETLAAAARDAGRVAEASDWWQRLATLAPDDSRVAVELMRALEASGNRAAALRHARVHSAILRETLGMEPDRSVQDLADLMARRSESPAAVVTAGYSDWEPAPQAEIRHESSPVPGSSIAVLPFINVSESDENAYFADGVSEELIYLLTRASGLRVASRTSAFAYRDEKLDVQEVARRLHVEWILEGSVRRFGNKLRIVVQLTDAGNGYQLWSESFDRTSSDIFAIQEEIAVAIARRLAPAMVESISVTAARSPWDGPDSDTYDLYLQARYQWHRRTEQSLSTSATLFEQVVALEPEYARAWAGLADAYAVMAFYDYLAPHEAFPRAESAARQAILLDATLAAPHATLAYVDTYYHWNWESAEQGFRRAIELEPTYSTAHQWYGSLLSARGRFDEAEWEARRAAELDPLSMIAHSVIGRVFMLANLNDRAIQQLNRVLQLDETFCLAHYWMGLALERKGQPLKAMPFFERVLELTRGCAQACPLVLAALARTHALAGDAHSARATLDELVELERSGRYVSSYEIGTVHLSLGDIPASLSRLERAYADRAHSIAFLKVDPQLRQLAGEPRFQALIERVDQALADRELVLLDA